MNKSTISIIILVVVVIIAGGAYFYFYGDNLPSGGSLLSPASNNADTIGAEALALLNKVKSLNIDADFFKSATYATLVDRTQEISSQPVGRANPFAPVDGVPNPAGTPGGGGTR